MLVLKTAASASAAGAGVTVAGVTAAPTGERGSSTNRREAAAKGNKTRSKRGRCLITNTIIRESRKGDEHGQTDRLQTSRTITQIIAF